MMWKSQNATRQILNPDHDPAKSISCDGISAIGMYLEPAYHSKQAISSGVCVCLKCQPVQSWATDVDRERIDFTVDLFPQGLLSTQEFS